MTTLAPPGAPIGGECLHAQTLAAEDHAARRTNVLGVGVSQITMADAVRTIDRWIVRRDPHYVCVTGVHGVMESQRDAGLRHIHNNAGLVTPDGMPLVWLNRLSGFEHAERVYGPDLLLAVCGAASSRPYRHFFYGGGPGVADRLAARLAARFPRMVVAGTYCPPFGPPSPAETREITRRINVADADVVWVGLSTPKQERWMSAHVGRVTAPVLIGVGAAFDFHAGLKKQAPRWMQRSGMEWLFRLSSEPRRLGPRYLLNNPLFVWNIMLQRLGIRRPTLHQPPLHS